MVRNIVQKSQYKTPKLTVRFSRGWIWLRFLSEGRLSNLQH